MSFEEDRFDGLPDALLHVIFNKIHDAESLCRCALVCKRFASIVPQVDTVSLSIIPRQSSSRGDDQLTAKPNYCADCAAAVPRSKNLFKRLIGKVISACRPIHVLLRIIGLKSRRTDEDEEDCSYYSPNEVLKNFREIQSLRIQLPGGGGIGSHGRGGGGGGDSPLLRWRAEFGSQLESCVILGAKSLRKSSSQQTDEERKLPEARQSEEQAGLLLTDDELKLSVVWTISCLIAASARHYLLQQVVSEHQMLRSAVVADDSKQGWLCMRREQIEELRSHVNSAAAEQEDSSLPLERTRMPAMKVKLWYVPVLELPASGSVMKGVTLLVIRPADADRRDESDADLVGRVFNGNNEKEKEVEEEERVFGEAVREVLKKKKKYILKMNYF